MLIVLKIVNLWVFQRTFYSRKVELNKIQNLMKLKKNYTYLIIEKIINKLASKKKWREALFLINLTNYSFGWLDNHILCCARATKEFKSYARPELVALRLSKLGYIHLFTKPVNAGLVNIGSMVHHVVNKKTGNPTKIFEKVFHHYHSQIVTREELLFDQINANVIAAPSFIGKFTQYPFISLFYDYIEGTPLTAKDKEIYKYELFKKLWTSNPTKKIIENCSYQDHVELLLSKDMISNMLDVSETDSDRTIVTLLEVNANKIIKEFRSLPKIILHRDINDVNIIKAYNGEFYLIDWDKWCVSNVGAGLLIKAEELFNPSIIRYLILIKGETDHFTPLEILRNVCIYNLTNELYLKNNRNAINWGYNYFALANKNYNLTMVSGK